MQSSSPTFRKLSTPLQYPILWGKLSLGFVSPSLSLFLSLSVCLTFILDPLLRGPLYLEVLLHEHMDNLHIIRFCMSRDALVSYTYYVCYRAFATINVFCGLHAENFSHSHSLQYWVTFTTMCKISLFAYKVARLFYYS